MQTDKIAVIELSTKAVKWLIPQVDNETIQNYPFDFKHFFRETQKTETGNGLNKNNFLDERYFVRNVLPYIKQAYDDIINKDVDIVYCVATAVYRSARNINSILQIIKDETDLDVRVLSKDEEAEYTFWAYFFSTKYRERLFEKPFTLLVDQGGGSTEISFFHNQKIVFRQSFDMGTTILKNDFFSKQDVPITERLNYIDLKYKKIIQNELNSINITGQDLPKRDEDIYCICVGTAITTALGPIPNKYVHDSLLDTNQIQNIIETLTKNFEYYSISDLQYTIEYTDGKSNPLEKKLVSRLGLPIISEIIQFFNVKNLRISGTGLWYGVFFANFHGIQID